ncbi:MAG: hypothetical protein ACFFCM_04130, partial [Promethearchaeota archaeon]
MSQYEFFCTKCEQQAIPIKIEHDTAKRLFIVIQKCLNHKTKFEIEEVEMKTYLNSIFESTLICPECGANYP